MNPKLDTRATSGSPMLDAQSFRDLMAARLPIAELMGIQVDAFESDHVIMRAVYSERFLRPGGTIAGPVMMGLADAAVYAAVLSRIGAVELAVTTQLSINFLRKPEPGDVLAKASLLKLGKRLAVAEVVLYSALADVSQPVAHATATYSIPPPQRESHSS